MIMRENNCKKCFWWVKAQDFSAGYCHRYPPQIIVNDVHYVRYVFPETGPSWFCGEFKSSE